MRDFLKIIFTETIHTQSRSQAISAAVISINEYITAGVITKILTINSADIDKSFI
jgi:hypothetical protein